jgi:hypothetical protein
MSPELITAVKERVQLGYTEDKIREELKGSGYTNEVIDEVLLVASGKKEVPIPVPVPTSPVSSGPVVFPGTFDLISDGFSFAFKRLDLFVLLAAPLVLFAIISSVGSYDNGLSINVIIPLVLAGLIIFIFYLLARATALHIAVENSSKVVSLGEGFNWAKKNFLGLLWVNLLVLLVVYGGFILLIVPGVIVSILVFFSQFVYAKEGIRGLSALLRSREIVKGNWGAVFGKLFLIGLCFFVVYILLTIVIGMFADVIGDQRSSTIVSVSLLQIVGVGFYLTFLNIGVRMFEILRQAKPYVVSPNGEEGRSKYTVLACIGMFIPVLGILSAIVLASLSDARDAGLEASLRASMSAVGSGAEVYFSENGNSYLGVCDEMEPIVTQGNPSLVVFCNDSNESWALTANLTRSSGVVPPTTLTLCVDSDAGPIEGGFSNEDNTKCSGQDYLDYEFNNSLDAKDRAAELREGELIEFEEATGTDLGREEESLKTAEPKYIPEPR